MKRREFITHAISGAIAFSATRDHAAAQERRYLTEEQSLKQMFTRPSQIVRDEKQLTDDQLRRIETTLGVRLRSRVQTVYRGVTQGATDGYAMIANEIGKEQFITFMVGITPAFKVMRVNLLVFRESRGWEVEDRRFSDQFRGKTSADRLLVGSDIVGVTGATLSSRAFCRGIKKALVICETLYKQ
jgi:Na+-translocating ferredoxin:NAD+ oxidoreductase RnfG subunit